MNDTFMKTKPVFPLLVSMALPNVISMLVNSLYNIVDSLFVAQINEQAMTALSLVFPIQNFVNAVAIGFGVGINALVALYRGAGDHDKADAAATHGMALSVLHGLLCTLMATAIMPGFLARFTADSWLFFGKETAGLPQPFREAFPDRCLRIPMRPDARSLNLANSVAILTYEALRQLDFPQLRGEGD